MTDAEAELEVLRRRFAGEPVPPIDPYADYKRRLLSEAVMAGPDVLAVVKRLFERVS